MRVGGSFSAYPYEYQVRTIDNQIRFTRISRAPIGGAITYKRKTYRVVDLVPYNNRTKCYIEEV